MTYCLGLKLDDGLVFASDTRTNAGVDYVTTYRKMHLFEPDENRTLVLLAAGNLATTTELVDTVRRDLIHDKQNSVAGCQSMFDAAQYLGQVSRSVQDRHAVALSNSGVSGEISLILGGQIRGGEHELYLIYPQGNYISASLETPFLQIGESKYGKPMLDRILHRSTSLADGARLALVSLDATVRSNLTVGLPYDLAIYQRDRFQLSHQSRIEADSPFYRSFRDAWQSGIESAFRGLPRFDWEGQDSR